VVTQTTGNKRSRIGVRWLSPIYGFADERFEKEKGLLIFQHHETPLAQRLRAGEWWASCLVTRIRQLHGTDGYNDDALVPVMDFFEMMFDSRQWSFIS